MQRVKLAILVKLLEVFANISCSHKLIFVIKVFQIDLLTQLELTKQQNNKIKSSVYGYAICLVLHVGEKNELKFTIKSNYFILKIIWVLTFFF